MSVDLPVCAAPYVRMGPHRRHLDRTLLAGLAPVVTVSVWLHGSSAAQLLAPAAAAALAGDWLGHFLRPGARRVRWAHALNIGLLLALIIPMGTSPLAAGVAALGSALVARVLRDRFGTYLWHPAVLAWMLVLLLGKYLPFGGTDVPPTPRPIDALAQVYAPPPDGGPRRLRDLALHELPAWEQTLTGAVPGAAGETCGLAILAAGLWLIYVRNLRWQVPVCALLAAAVVAAMWPLRGSGGGWLWWPVAMRVDGFPIGMPLVLYHLTGGGLLLAAVFLAADTISTPLNARGHALFGAGLGAGTVALCACGLTFGASWWALLLMNTLVPVIDRLTRRRVWGT